MSAAPPLQLQRRVSAEPIGTNDMPEGGRLPTPTLEVQRRWSLSEESKRSPPSRSTLGSPPPDEIDVNTVDVNLDADLSRRSSLDWDSMLSLPPPPEPAAPEVSGRAAVKAAGLAERSRQTLERVRREGESMSTDENDEFSPLRI